MATYFISDLHLSPEKPLLAEAFYAFLSSITDSVDALYILGDFFDAWIGDDEDHPFYAEIEQALYQFTHTAPVYFMRGNRDFLIGKAFAERTGIALLENEVVIDLYGRETLLCHGDSLCTSDHMFMAWRQQVLSADWQAKILALPLAERRKRAKDLRQASMDESKLEVILDATEEAVEAALLSHQVQSMIHGHTHKPACHDLVVNDRFCQRLVLGDWRDSSAFIIKCDYESTDLLEFHYPV